MAKPRRKSRALLFIVLVVVIVFAVILKNLFSPAASTPRNIEVTVPEGASINRVARRLQRRGLIRSAFALRILARVNGTKDVKAGIYTLSPSMAPSDILAALEKGSREPVYRVTIPEGYTLEQIAERCAAAPGIDPVEFQRLATMRGRSFNVPFPTPPNLEGYLFPDTYDFTKKDTAQTAIQRMLDAFQQKVNAPLSADFAASAAHGYTQEKIITIASLIEREAKVKTDQPLIAAVIYNRLSRGMPLQVDATVQYVIGHRERLLYRDLEVDSPYNTYKVAGLPPGPICSPGLGAIRAALHPAKAAYLYYTANRDGSHTFTTNLSAHERATAEARAERAAHGG